MATVARERGFPIPARLVEFVLLGPGEGIQLQDSPILGDVWIAYAAHPGQLQDLLITPHKEARAGDVAKKISDRIGPLRKKTKRSKSASIAYLQGIVASQLYLDELLRVIVPMTRWWSSKDVQRRLEEEKNYNPGELKEWIERLLRSATSHDGSVSPLGAQSRFAELQRYVALAGILLWASKTQVLKRAKDSPLTLEETSKKIIPHVREIVRELLDLFAAIKADLAAAKSETLVFQISLNRRAMPALERSVPAVKGDAARNLFKISCKDIAWAILDSGIQSDHPAFADKRVKATLDFTRVRDIISSDSIGRKRRRDLLQGISVGKVEAERHLKKLAADATEGSPLNWDVVEELISLDQDDTSNQPTTLHGTHVAGIIGASGQPIGHADGMCPDIQLYDFRVLGETMDETEFAIIAALQYIRFMNERYSYVTIHGANLSLSIPHDVRNYACGSTPICKECERLVESGVVVVAAAGNLGYQHFETSEGVFESYAAFSITDPGNADGVITVGATHANWPHTYGVSFFSSRGPTGDGRLKPDLVAPGERIEAPVLDSEWAQQSGTSMAAPHVGGAAAMLLARYPELIGQPRRIKHILCESATDLGRERNFQGHGMLDVLRALQSI